MSILRSAKKNHRLLPRASSLVWLIFSLVLGLWLKFAFIASSGKNAAPSSALPLVERGAIYDRNQQLIAMQVEKFTISVWLPLLRERAFNETPEARLARITKTAHVLAPIVLWPQDELLSYFMGTGRSNTLFLVRRGDVSLRNRVITAIQEHNLLGVQITPELSRAYPQGALAASLLGYLNSDGRGGEGLEYAFDRFLAPAPISNKLETDGYSLELTLDINLQASIETLLRKAMVDHSAAAAVALILDANTAEILSYASLPSYDPTHYNLSTVDQRMNRPTIEAFEPGSVFKIFSLAALLDGGYISEDDQFYCPGFYTKQVGNETITIRCTGVHGWQSMAQVLANSCNAGTAYASDAMTNQNFYNKMREFGFGQRTGIPLAGETNGLLANPRKWSARSKPTIALGQEVGVSALQLVQAATTLTNNGAMIKPRIVRRLIDTDGNTFQSYDREVVAQVLTPATAQAMLNQMEFSVQHGIARRLQLSGLSVGAKTGTSQTINRTTGVYSADSFIASTLALVPAQNPQYIIYVALHRPSAGTIWGSTLVAPLIRDMIELMIPLVGLPALGVRHWAAAQLPQQKQPYYPTFTSHLPSLVGLHRRQALNFFTHPDVNYRLIGTNDIIYDQFPPEGTLLRSEMSIRLETQ